jgi:glutathione peroxidase
MMKKLILSFSLALLCAINVQSQNQPEMSFYNLKMKSLEGKAFDFASLKGKKVMIVNTASECGYTKQYAQLQELHEMYSSKGLVIIGVPSNNFGGQEPGSAQEIIKFCSANYGVTFLMLEKSVVKGKEMCDLYKWLTTKELNGHLDTHVKWNFQKYLIDEDGHLVRMIEPATSPLDVSIIKWIEGK